MADPSNSKLTDEEFLRERDELFRTQLGGEPLDLAEAVAFAQENVKRGSVAQVLQRAKSSGDPAVVPRAGVSGWEEQRQLMRALDEAGAAYLPVTIDSLTRELHFADAKKRLEAGTPLNGYPLVAHGIESNRLLFQQFDKPVIVRANAVDLRVTAEYGFASGATAFVSGPMYATIYYSKNTAIADGIRKWQYLYRLMGHYTEAGVAMADDAVGFSQSGTCSVPALMHVGVVLDALIMAAQGVKHIMVYSMLQGNLAQDIASCLAVEQLVNEYLSRLGLDGVETYVASSDWNGAFPTRRPDAYGLIAANVVAAALAKAPLNYVKTIDEGIGVPTAQANADSIRVTRYLLRLIGRQADAWRTPEVEFELALNLMQARAILDNLLDVGDGDPVVGTIRTLASGELDIPFSPNVNVRGSVLPIRDAAGAVRFLDYGALPIPSEARDMERERLAARRADTASLGYQDVVDDLEFLELHN